MKTKDGKKVSTNPLSGKNALQIIGFIVILTGVMSSELGIVPCIILILIGTGIEFLGNRKAQKKQAKEDELSGGGDNFTNPDNF